MVEAQDGKCWNLSVEYYTRAGGWRKSASVQVGPRTERDGTMAQMIMAKDYPGGDSSSNDFVLRLEDVDGGFKVASEFQVAGEFQIAGEPYPADASLRDLGTGGLGGAEPWYLAVSVRNTSRAAFGYDTVLDISDLGRDRLAAVGVLVQDRWSSAALRATGQEVFGRAVSVSALAVGGSVTCYFPIDASRSQAAAVDVQFELLPSYASGPGVGETRLARGVMVADSLPARLRPSASTQPTRGSAAADLDVFGSTVIGTAAATPVTNPSPEPAAAPRPQTVEPRHAEASTRPGRQARKP